MKIFRPNFKNIQENIHGFSKIQRNDIPGNLEQKATINRMRTAYSGFYGTPDQTLTGGLPLRRRSLYTTELQGHMQKYSIVQLRWTRDRRMLGGGPSIPLPHGQEHGRSDRPNRPAGGPAPRAGQTARPRTNLLYLTFAALSTAHAAAPTEKRLGGIGALPVIFSQITEKLWTIQVEKGK